MTSKDIGSLFNTKMPGYEDPADIQDALKLYHYGSSTYPATNTDPAQIVRPSVAGHLQDLRDDINQVLAIGSGNILSNTEPTAPYDGMIWVDKDETVASSVIHATSIYQTTAPTTGLADGLIWIKKGTTPLELWVYDSATSAFVKVGA